MRTRAAAVASGLALGFLLGSSALLAEGAPRVLLVPDGQEELARKVEAEAAAAGFPLLRAARRPGDARSLPTLVGEHSANAALELESADSVRIHVTPVGNERAYDALVERTALDGDGFASRVVEQLRGRLVELDLLPAPSNGPPKPTAPAPRDPQEVPRSEPPETAPRQNAEPSQAPMLALVAGGGASVASGGFGAVPALGIGLRAEPGFGLALSGRALIPLGDSSVTAPEGTASVDVELFLGELALRVFAPSPWSTLEAGAGGGAAVLPVEAEAAAPYQGKNDRLVTGLFYLHVGGGVSVSSWLHLRSVFRAGVNAPRPVVRFDGRQVASWGRAFAVATLEGELGWALSSGSAR